MKLLFLCILLLPLSLHAEIEWVTVDWNPGVCTLECIGRVQNRLYGLDSVSKVAIAPSETLAKMTWKPNYPFDYKKLEYALAWVGIGIRNTGIKMRGTITHDSSNVYLTSIGDRTRVILLEGQPTPASANSSGELYTLGNPFYYPLTGTTRDKLRTAERNYQVVSIEGYFLMVWRGPPYNVIITKLSIEDKNTPPQNRPGM